MDYKHFLSRKKKCHDQSGFTPVTFKSDKLFDFQKHIIKKACKAGKYAIFADCGLGKTAMQLEWAYQVNQHTKKPVLILAPLAVVGQTIQEGNKFGVKVTKIGEGNIQITNYEQLKNIDTSIYSGVVLDESSILKGKDGKLSALLIETFKNFQYKLCCTATPSPNDHMELGQHAEFLNAMSYQEMLAMFFVHDGGQTSKWRLRKHATDDFWKFVCTWSVSLDNPKTLGFNDGGYQLPQINYIEHFIPVDKVTDKLFQDTAVSATDINRDLRLSLLDRVQKAKEIIGDSKEQWIIWGLQNAETDLLAKELDGSINIQGSDSSERKTLLSLWFANNENECVCNIKAEKKNTKKSIGINTTQKTKTGLIKKTEKELSKKEHQTKNIDNQELNIQKNITKKIKKNSIKEHQNKSKSEIEKEEKNTHKIGSTGNGLKSNQEILVKKTLKQDLKESLNKNIESRSSNIKPCSNNKMENVQSVEQNQAFSNTNKDYISIIATEQEKSGDCCALTAIKDLENSKIMKYLSNVQYCTCGKVKRKILISKASILGFGMNYQNCHNMIFCSYDFKFEAFYQAVRRCYRFGQSNTVNVHLLIPETQQNVRQSILQKEKKHFEMIHHMSLYSANNDFKLNKSQKVKNKEVKTENYHCINGDCVKETSKLPGNSADIVIFSPPFAELYVYSDKPEDMGNSSNYDEFSEHFKYLIPQLSRVLKDGRICAVHCMDLPVQKGKEGFIGLRDFSGMLIKCFQDEGFIYHARTTIWKNPVTEMQRTKALGLLHKQIKKDSVMSRVGIPDYVLFFRNKGTNKAPIIHQDKDPSKPDYLPVDLWQKYASPVWMDINYQRTLQYTTARDSNDEKHICPLQLDTIERILHLYSNEGDTVLSPFGGIGSEGWQALKMGRKSISIELKESYYNVNVRNHKSAIQSKSQLELL